MITRAAMPLPTAARAGRIALLAVATVVLAGATPPGDRGVPPLAGAQEAEVVALFVDGPTQQPTLVLQGRRDGRRLVMAIGLAEATGIAAPLTGASTPRPLTHDLFLTVFSRLNVTVVRAVVNDLRDGVYYATLVLATAGGE